MLFYIDLFILRGIYTLIHLFYMLFKYYFQYKILFYIINLHFPLVSKYYSH